MKTGSLRHDEIVPMKMFKINVLIFLLTNLQSVLPLIIKYAFKTTKSLNIQKYEQ